MTNYLADTTILIDHLCGNHKAKYFLKNEQPSISTVTIAELIQGSRNKEDLASALKVCKSLPEAAIDKKISGKAIKLLENLRLSENLMFLDALIAATALENNLTLVTGNVKHFKKINGLKLISQESLFKNIPD